MNDVHKPNDTIPANLHPPHQGSAAVTPKTAVAHNAELTGATQFSPNKAHIPERPPTGATLTKRLLEELQKEVIAAISADDIYDLLPGDGQDDYILQRMRENIEAVFKKAKKAFS